MNNWDAREEEGNNCTIGEDLKSIEMTCKALEISKLHHVNYQSSYWQRVFSPVLSGYQNGDKTPNPDILCNREIKFGELYDWSRGRADFLATGHYARITCTGNGWLMRQAKDLGKDQTYFLAAINRSCLERTMFPVGNLLKSAVKGALAREAGLDHLFDRKESMGLCFIGKRGKFRDFMANFVPESEPGAIIDFESGAEIARHQGLSNYTLGQNVAVSGAKSRLYLVKKDLHRNALLVVDSLLHPALWTRTFKLADFGGLGENDLRPLFCCIRSVDKTGTRVRRVSRESDGNMEVELDDQVYAPCPGQWAVFYTEDGGTGRICLGGGPII